MAFRVQKFDVEFVPSVEARDGRLGTQDRWGWSLNSSALRCPHPSWYARRMGPKTTPLWILTTPAEHADGKRLQGEIFMRVTIFVNWDIETKDGSGHAFTSVATGEISARSLSLTTPSRLPVVLTDVTNQDGAGYHGDIVLDPSDFHQHTASSVSALLAGGPDCDRSSTPMVPIPVTLSSWRATHMPRGSAVGGDVKWTWTGAELDRFGVVLNSASAVFIPPGAQRPTDALLYFLRYVAKTGFWGERKRATNF